MSQIHRFSIGLFALTLSIGLWGCSWKPFKALVGGGEEAASIKEAPGEGDIFTIQKNEGINVNEADNIWVVGMKGYNASTQTRVLKVHKMKLNVQDDFPVSTWDIVLRGDIAVSGAGIRTYVSRYGLLLARNSSGRVALYLVSPVSGPSLIYSGSGFAPNGRASTISYLIQKNGVEHEYIAIAVKDVQTNRYRLIRFLREAGAWRQVSPYVFNVTASHAAGVYAGFLDACGQSEFGVCRPRFFGGIIGSFFGINLDADVPGGAATTSVTIPSFSPINENFVSTSHPVSGPMGTINKESYTITGDEDGNLARAMYPDTSWGNNFLSYDRVNKVFFHVNRATRLQPDGTMGTEPQSLVTVYRKECFSTDPNCDPVAPEAKARFYRDIGTELGATSDLGNGCVAILSFRRPGEPGGETYQTRIYRACLRDGRDLNKGLVVALLGKVEGAAYMYNDFTGGTLFDRPNYILFDFAERGYTKVNKVSYHWVPKLGFSNNMLGLKTHVRCYKKGSEPSGDAGFVPIEMKVAGQVHELAECAGVKDYDMVEFKFERDKSSAIRFTRLQTFALTADGDRDE